jgi:oxygen-independent coproporphyrinogen-3 oxidase
MSPLVTSSDYLATSTSIEDDALPPAFTTAMAPGITASQYADVLGAWDLGGKPHVSVHVRLPFCPSRCLSCDHHTSVTHNRDAIDDYLDGLDEEISLVTRHIGRHLPLAQLHLGGGTPNYLSDTQFSRLMDVLDRHFSIGADTESSLEANPQRSSPSQLALLRGLGFQVINFQIRDIENAVQFAVGRSNSLPLLRDVFDCARAEGFTTLSTDLVYGLPNQTLTTVEDSVGRLLELSPERVVCQAFSRRPDVFKHQRAIDPASMPSVADKVAMFNSACETMLARDYEWVGLDCFAHRRDPLATAREQGKLFRNWVGYTTRDVGDLFGFGADAITQIGSANVQNRVQIQDWRRALKHGELPIESGMLVSETERRRRSALNALMCNLELADYRDLLDEDGDNDTLAALARDGLVQVSNEKVAVTEYGRFALHQLWGEASPHFRAMGAL